MKTGIRVIVRGRRFFGRLTNRLITNFSYITVCATVAVKLGKFLAMPYLTGCGIRRERKRDVRGVRPILQGKWFL